MKQILWLVILQCYSNNIQYYVTNLKICMYIIEHSHICCVGWVLAECLWSIDCDLFSWSSPTELTLPPSPTSSSLSVLIVTIMMFVAIHHSHHYIISHTHVYIIMYIYIYVCIRMCTYTLQQSNDVAMGKHPSIVDFPIKPLFIRDFQLPR